MLTLLQQNGQQLVLSLLFSLFIAMFSETFGQTTDCSINAGGNAIICGSTTTLTGASTGTSVGSPTWTFVSGPVTPIIISPNTLATSVTGMTTDGNYVFSITQPCATGTATSQVTITAHPRPTTFTAGTDVTNVFATVGTVNLSDAVIPAGFTGTWTAYNIYARNRSGTTVSTNSTFSSNTIANPVFSLIKKADHDIDPAYVLTLTITSLDGVCTYEDTKVVRFIPNPIIQPTLVSGNCVSPPVTVNSYFVDFLSSSPKFNTVIAETAANPAYGTTVTLNVVSQPLGGNISLAGIVESSRILLNGINATGEYNFTLTVTNAAGTYTTPTIKYNFNGTSPYPSHFNLTAHPEQMTLYGSTAASGGELHSSAKIGNTAPETFYFDIDPLNPNTVVTTVTQLEVLPTSGTVGTITVSGAGTANRSATVNAPVGGWKVGTYKFRISNAFPGGGCASTQLYYIHVSDSNRPDVAVSDFSICYPGTGAISAIVQLPAVYQGVIDPSYFQDYSGVYNFELLSSPDGAATPAYSATNLRSLTSTSTIIGNLNKAGDYRFRITAANLFGSNGPFLDAEYASSGSSMTDEFTIHVENRVNSNAGSDQSMLCPTTVSLIGNATGASSGEWSVISAPALTTPSFTNATNPSTSVTGLTEEGNYEFAWTITSPLGGCVTTDNVVVTRVCSGATITIPANIWVDADGDAIIDGGEGGVANGLWANLLDPSGKVITSVEIQPDGSYSFEVPKNVLTETGTYSIALTNGIKSVGTYITAADVPLNDYLYTGTNRGGTTSVNPTNQTGILTIGDLSTVTDGTTTNPVNFGIQRPPVADPKEFEVGNSAFSATPPTDYPNLSEYQSISASSASLTGYPNGGSFSGSDPEDCPAVGACNTGTTSTFNIETINANTILYYDFGGVLGIMELTGGSSIPNFDVTKLVIYGENGGGTTSNPIGFTYSITDKAGTTSAAVPYTIETQFPLPVTLISFNAYQEGQVAILKWTTSSERNSKGFGIERSTDAKNWNTLTFVNSKNEVGNSSVRENYEYVDQNPLSGINYYRLKQTDFDESFAYSRVASLKVDSRLIVNVYPNPANDKVMITGLNLNEQIVISNITGQKLKTTKVDHTQMTVDLSNLSDGIYLIQVIRGSEVYYSKKVIKAR